VTETDETVSWTETFEPEPEDVNYDDDTDSDSDDDYEEWDEPTVGDKIKDKIISYGFDQEVVSAWLENKGASWDELAREQAEAKAEIAKANIAEANAYF
jgi:hypothetical protein